MRNNLEKVANLGKLIALWQAAKAGAGRMAFKHPGLGGVASGFGNVMKAPISAGKTGAKVLSGALAVPLVAEMGYKTTKNFAAGNPSLGDVSWTGGQIGRGLNWLSEGTGVGPALTEATRRTLDGVAQSPNVNRALDTAEKFSMPETRDMAKKTIVDSVADASRSAGFSMMRGALSGAGQAVLDNPVPTLAGATALGVAPMMAYDLANRKKREEQANQQRVILDFVRRQNEQAGVKTASLAGGAVKLLSKLRPWLYRPSTVNLGQLQRTMGNTPNAADVIKQINKGLPQTLLNNSFSRNPGKTILGGTMGIGAVHGAAKTGLDPNSGVLDAGLGMVGGAMNGPYEVFKTIESAALKNDRNELLKQHPVVQQVQRIKDGFQAGQGTQGAVQTPAPITPSTPAATPAGSIAGADVPAHENWLTPEQKQIAAGGVALGAPLLGYSIYDRMLNRDRRKMEASNQKKTNRLVERAQV